MSQTQNREMNHCVIEVEVQKAPTLRYTQDNKTPIAEMEVSFAGLRPEDSPGELKVVGWGNLAQEIQSKISVGQKLILEGRLRMNTIPRQDGTKEKKAELTLSRLHPLSEQTNRGKDLKDSSVLENSSSKDQLPNHSKEDTSDQNVMNWNSAPLVPETDDIPF